MSENPASNGSDYVINFALFFIGVESFADSLGCTSLVTACQKYVKKFFNKVAETEEFMSLEIEEVSKFISEDELFVSSEQLVFNAVIKWVKYDRYYIRN